MTPTFRKQHTWKLPALLVLSVLAAGLGGCGDQNRYQPPPPPELTVSKPLRQPVTDYLLATGTVAPSQSVDLVARVEGYLRRVQFKDGSFVKAGDPLFVIEPEPYEAKVKSQQAQLLSAQSEYDRQLRMLKENATSQANVENWRSQRDQAAAALRLAEINLGYTHISAPFSGRIGRRLIDVGNLVGSGSQTKLATIERLDPAYVYFSVNERDVLRIREAARRRGLAQDRLPAVPIYLGLQTEDGYPHQGTLDYAGSGLDTSSGTLQLRAVLANPDRMFLPGVFVRVRIPLGEPVSRLVLPDRVVSTDQIGSYVLTVGPDHVVRQRRVETGSVQDGMRVILSGLEPDTEVVTDGLQSAVPGNRANPVERPLTTPTSTLGMDSPRQAS
jgi:membrane fusion protein, multidrug efflux system